MTVAEWFLSLTYALVASMVVRALMCLKRTVTRMRRHRMFANRRFMRRFHAGHSKNCRTVVTAYLPYSLPLTGPAPHAGRRGRVPAAPAGSSQAKQAA